MSSRVVGRRPSIRARSCVDDFLIPMGISVYELAKAIKVPRSRANDIVLGRRAITADTALRLGRYFGTTPEFWINLQAQYDLDLAVRALRKEDRTGGCAARGLSMLSGAQAPYCCTSNGPIVEPKEGICERL